MLQHNSLIKYRLESRREIEILDKEKQLIVPVSVCNDDERRLGLAWFG
jgi:hypothetical protein